MHIFNFGTFVRVLQGHIGNSGLYNNEAELTYGLLSFGGSEFQFDEEGGSYASNASKYRSGAYAIPTDVVASFLKPRAKDLVKADFETLIVDNIPIGGKSMLIQDMVALIETDDAMDPDYKDLLLSEAKPNMICDFLADLLIFVVTASPKKVDKQLAKLAGPALTVLVNEAVPELLKTMLALFYIKVEDDSDAAKALNANDYRGFVQSLLKERRLSGIDLFHWTNMCKIAGVAHEELLSSTEENVPADFNIDWYTRFYESASGISDEEMQRLWAKLLAGEIRRPGSFSLRTIETLKNLSASEAKAFSAISNAVYTNVDNEMFYYPHVSIVYRADSNCLVDMLDAGLLGPKETYSCISYNDSENLVFFDYNNNGLLIIDDRKKRIPSYDRYLLTISGQELLTVVDRDQSAVIANLTDIASDLHRKGFHCQIRKILAIDSERHKHTFGEILFDFDGEHITQYIPSINKTISWQNT